MLSIVRYPFKEGKSTEGTFSRRSSVFGRQRYFRSVLLTAEDRRLKPDVRITVSQASVPRDAFPPTPPGPEGSNGNGLLRVQWASGA
jgi:hypothetical protein